MQPAEADVVKELEADTAEELEAVAAKEWGILLVDHTTTLRSNLKHIK